MRATHRITLGITSTGFDDGARLHRDNAGAPGRRAELLGLARRRDAPLELPVAVDGAPDEPPADHRVHQGFAFELGAAQVTHHLVTQAGATHNSAHHSRAARFTQHVGETGQVQCFWIDISSHS